MSDKSDEEAYAAFLDPLMDDLRRGGFPGKRGRGYEHDRRFETPFPGISYRFGFWPTDRSNAAVYLWIHAQDQRDRNQHIYQQLLASRAEIDAAMGVGEPLTNPAWNPNTWHKDQGYAAVGVCTPGGIRSSDERLAEIRAWVLEYLPRIKEVLDPRLEEILHALP